MKKNENENFVPDMEKIKEKDKEKLRKTFELVFGKDSSSIKGNSRDLKRKIYLYGVIFVGVMLIVIFLTK
tara:strand:- start:140 stop:349 length:210 start_codon:yes stop_codon:yes gene_type:complete